MESDRLTDEELKRLEWECSEDGDGVELMSEFLVLRLLAEVKALRADINDVSNAAEVYDFDDMSDYGLDACGLTRHKRKP